MRRGLGIGLAFMATLAMAGCGGGEPEPAGDGGVDPSRLSPAPTLAPTRRRPRRPAPRRGRPGGSGGPGSSTGTASGRSTPGSRSLLSAPCSRGSPPRRRMSAASGASTAGTASVSRCPARRRSGSSSCRPELRQRRRVRARPRAIGLGSTGAEVEAASSRCAGRDERRQPTAALCRSGRRTVHDHPAQRVWSGSQRGVTSFGILPWDLC